MEESAPSAATNARPSRCSCGVSHGQPEQAKPEFQPITSQEQLNALLGDRLARERTKFADYDKLKAKAEKANLSELEKATKANAQLKQELEVFKLRDLHSQVAASKGFSLEAAAHLVGPHLSKSTLAFPKHAPTTRYIT
ncbi:hypothetical protein [Tessaracoccus timonensis]|uniref:hypothetical protein n=1 Tax=Tessaracoccus timonensis TaxID=2161816 RepID=UPI000D558453|nr:hypothetical protein [Tessaracoccus timonensis]